MESGNLTGKGTRTAGLVFQRDNLELEGLSRKSSNTDFSDSPGFFILSFDITSVSRLIPYNNLLFS